jgi:hypothetical protein
MGRRFLALLLAGTMLAGVTQPARAEPITASIAAFAATQLGGIIVSTAVSVAFSFGASLLKNMFAPTPSKPKPNLAMRLSVAVGGIVAQSFLMGDWATAGSMNYRGSWGEDGGTPNAFYVEERVLADLPMPALTGFWFGPQKGTLLTGEAHPDFGWPVAQARRGGIDHMWVKYRDGTQTTADPYLVAKFGISQFPYSADMVGRGRAVAIVTRKVPNEDNRDLFPANLEYKFETSGIALYDLSKDSTAGGFGAHRWDNPATWEPSGNTAVQVYNILRGIRYGSEWLFGLQTLAAARVPASVWIAGINECNLAMALAAGGTEPQFRTGAEISVDMDAAGVIEELLAGASGRIAEVGGVYKTLFGAPGAAVMSFTDRDIVVTREQGYSPNPRIEQTFNGIRPKFVNPANGWDLGDAPARYPTAEQLEEDGGRELMADVTLKTVNSVTRTQRLVKAASEEQRRWRRHQLGFAPIFSELEPLDAVSWTSTENGYENKKFLVTDLEDEPTYLQGASLQEWDPADYDYDAGTEERPGWSAPIGVVRPPPQIAQAWNVSGVTVVDDLSRSRRAAAEWTWDGTVEDVRAVAFEARIRAGAEAGTLVLTEGTDLVSAGTIQHAGGRLLPGAKLEGRIRYLPRGPRATEWTAWLAFDLPDVRMSVHDMADEFKRFTGALGGEGSLLERLDTLRDRLAQLANTATAITSTHYLQVEDARAEFTEQLTLLANEVEASVELTTLLVAQFGSSTAVAAQHIGVTASELYAQAVFSQEVAVEFGGITASGLRTTVATAGPEGWEVKIADIVRASGAGVDVEAGTYTLINSGGEALWVCKASRFAFISEDLGVVKSVFAYDGATLKLINAEVEGDLVVRGTIRTEHLQLGAVLGMVTTGKGPVVWSGGGSMQAAAIYVPEGVVRVDVNCVLNRPSESPWNYGYLTIYVIRNGSVIDSRSIFYDDNFAYPISFTSADTPPAGATHVYSVEASGGSWSMQDCVIALTNHKRVG